MPPSNEQSAITVWGTGVLFPGVKQPGFEADHFALSNAKVERVQPYTSFHMCMFTVHCLINTLVFGNLNVLV
jgi:hypothetical protein